MTFSSFGFFYLFLFILKASTLPSKKNPAKSGQIGRNGLYCTSAQANFLKLRSKQKLKRHRVSAFRGKSTASTFWLRTIWFRKVHENYLMRILTFKRPNFRRIFSAKTCVHRLITLILLFTNILKPYSSESKFWCRRFDTFKRFFAFVLAKLPLKPDCDVLIFAHSWASESLLLLKFNICGIK